MVKEDLGEDYIDKEALGGDYVEEEDSDEDYMEEGDSNEDYVDEDSGEGCMSSYYPIPRACTARSLHLSEEDSNKNYTEEALHKVLEHHWKTKFEDAEVDTNSSEYRSWLSFFDRKNISHGTVHVHPDFYYQILIHNSGFALNTLMKS